MKVIYEHGIGGDGAKAGAYIDGADLVAKVSFPLEKALAPINDVIDKAIDKIESTVPGDWDKALLEPIRAEAKAALVKLLSE